MCFVAAGEGPRASAGGSRRWRKRHLGARWEGACSLLPQASFAGDAHDPHHKLRARGRSSQCPCNTKSRESQAWTGCTPRRLRKSPPSGDSPSPVNPSCLAPGNRGCFPAWPRAGAGQPCPPHSPSARPATCPFSSCSRLRPGRGHSLGLGGDGARWGNGTGPATAYVCNGLPEINA